MTARASVLEIQKHVNASVIGQERVVERLAQTEGQADMIEVMRVIRGVLGDPAA